VATGIVTASCGAAVTLALVGADEAMSVPARYGTRASVETIVE
jgi:hypothetical protein